MVVEPLSFELFLPNNLSRNRVELQPVTARVEHELRHVARNGFGIETINSFSRIGNSGILSSNYLLSMDGFCVVLKARPSGDGVSMRLTNEIKLFINMYAKGLAVPKPFRTLRGSYVFKAFESEWSCYHHCSGTYFYGYPGELEAAAQSYTDLTQALSNANKEWQGQYIEGKLVKDLAALVYNSPNPPTEDRVMGKFYHAHRDELLKLIDQVIEEQPMIESHCQVMHTDFHPLNILMKNGCVNAILDFEDVKVYPVTAASGFAAYKLIRQSLVGIPSEERLPEAQRMVNYWMMKFRSVIKCQPLEPRTLGMGALYRVLGLLHTMLDAWFRRGDTKFNFDFPKQMGSIREIRIIFDII